MIGIYLRQYGVALDVSTAGSLKIRTKLRQAGSDAFATDSHWTPGAADVVVSKDFGAEANIGTLPSYVNGWWEIELSASELTAKQVGVAIDNAATVPEAFIVETFGDPLAMYSVDWSGTDAHEVTTNERVLLALPDVAAGNGGGLSTMENGNVLNASGMGSSRPFPGGLLVALDAIRVATIDPNLGFGNPQASPGEAGGLAVFDTQTAIKAKTDTIGTGTLKIISDGFGQDSSLRITRGDSYGTGNGKPALTIVDEEDKWPDISTATTITLTVRFQQRREGVEPTIQLTASGTAGTTDGHKSASFIVQASATASMTPGPVEWDIEAKWADGSVATIAGPEATGLVRRDQTHP